jgi:hypothetical protein
VLGFKKNIFAETIGKIWRFTYKYCAFTPKIKHDIAFKENGNFLH